jgi:Tfp pilus assembly protein PilX
MFIARRSSERGSTMFIVMMVFLMISTVGIFAVSSARYEQRAAGFDLHRSSAVELSAFGANLVAQQMSGQYAGRALAKMRKSTRPENLPQTDPCSANIAPNLACWNVDTHTIETNLNMTGTNHVVALATGSGTNVLPGAFGITAMNGNFSVQLTELAENKRTVPGDESKMTCYMDVTITSTGVLWVDDGASGGTAANGNVDGGERASMTTAVSRARATIGPLRRAGGVCGG